MNRLNLAAATIAGVLVLHAGAAGAEPPPAAGASAARPQIDKRLVAEIRAAKAVMIAKVASVKMGPVGMSMPPYWTMTLKFKDARVLKGKFSPADGLFYGRKQKQAPRFPPEQAYVFLLWTPKGKWRAKRILEATPANVKAAEAATGSGVDAPSKDVALHAGEPWYKAKDVKEQAFFGTLERGTPTPAGS